MINQAASIAAGGDFSLALSTDTTVWKWGSYDARQSSDLTFEPSLVEWLSEIRLMNAGYVRAAAIDNENLIWAWGNNGDETRTEPVQLIHPDPKTKVVEVGISTDEFVCLLEDGTVWEWTTVVWQGPVGKRQAWESVRPKRVPQLDQIKTISAGVGHSLAIKSDGTVWGWGWNRQGELASEHLHRIDNRTGMGDPFPPMHIDGISEIIAVSAVSGASIALKEDGTVWAWGGNRHGQLGLEGKKPRFTPTHIASLESIVQISGGIGDHVFAIDRDGLTWGWGKNNCGQLGNPEYREEKANRPILCFDKRFQSISSGIDHTLALDSHGQVWAWGSNGYGQIGTGDKEGSNAPTHVNIGYVF